MSLRQKLGRKLISAGISVYGKLEEAPSPAEPVAQAAPESRGAVVTAVDTPQNWHPHQRGNVVIAEPLLMTKYRRQGGSVDDDM